MLLGYTRTPLAAMAGGHISYNPAVRFANLRASPGPSPPGFALQGRFPFSLFVRLDWSLST